MLISGSLSKAQVTWNGDGSVTVVGTEEFVYHTGDIRNSDDNELYISGQAIYNLKNPQNYGGLKVKNLGEVTLFDCPTPSIPAVDGAVVTMRLYNTDTQTLGSLIYGSFASGNLSYTFAEGYEEGYWVGESNIFFKNHDSKDVKYFLAENMSASTWPPSEDYLWLYGRSMNLARPVYISVTVTDATLESIKIPGIGVLSPATLFAHLIPDPVVEITVIKPDGITRGQYQYGIDPTENDQVVDAVIGDQITYKVYNSLSEPEIFGLPSVWLAALGREYYYHCDPSIIPGGVKPKVAFDVQSHHVSSKEAPLEYYPDWVQDETDPNIYTLTWYAQRRTDATQHKYQAEYSFKKADYLNGKLQRKNKSQGQNMDFIEMLNADKSVSADGGFRYSSINRKYYWNIDSDEMLYLNSKEINTKAEGWSGHVKRVPLYSMATDNDPFSSPSLADPSDVESSVGQLYEPWQLIREGDYQWSDVDGYPSQGFVINEMVDAYREYHDTGYDVDGLRYRGYEIEDYCLYKDKDGNCYLSSENVPAEVILGATYNREGSGTDDNNKHPGNFSIFFSDDFRDDVTINIPIKVEAPLETDYGFYGNIEAPSYSTGMNQVTLKVIGLPKDLSATEQDQYTIETRSYNLQDWPVATYQMGIDGTYDATNGTWEIPYIPDSNQGQSATLYFSSDPDDNATSVIINGSEWKNTAVAYIFTTTDNCSDCIDLENGYGEFPYNYQGGIGYQYDYASDKVNTWNDGLTYTGEYFKEYVFHQDDGDVAISCMDWLDNMWDMHGKAYYWGYRALAKQVTDEYLAENLTYSLTSLSTGEITLGEDSRTFKFSPSSLEVGDYELKVFFMTIPSLKVKIKIVDYNKYEVINDESIPVLASIKTRTLDSDEKGYLGITDDESTDYYQLAYVDDILAQYLYVDGYRAEKHDGSKNRFAEYNDFRAEFVWSTLDDSDNESALSNRSDIQAIIDAYDPRDEWLYEWKDWLRHFSFGHWPAEVVSAESDQTSDSDVRSYLASLFEDESSAYHFNDFLRSVVWLAPTDYQGYRVNNIMKSIVDLETFFNEYAFEGVLSPEKSETVFTRDVILEPLDQSDDVKNKVNFFEKLKNGEMIVYDASTVDNLRVYNTDGTHSTFMAGDDDVQLSVELMVGQDIETILNYINYNDVDKSLPIPTTLTSYINLYSVLTYTEEGAEPGQDEDGCSNELVEWYGGIGEDPDGNNLFPDISTTPRNLGAGWMNARLLADAFPDLDLNIGLFISSIQTACAAEPTGVRDITSMSKIPDGTYDAEIDRVIEFCKSRTSQQIYLRIGYEFDLIWLAGYENTDDYKNAFQHIVGRFVDQGVTNVKFVWQATCSPLNYTDYLAYTGGNYDANLFHGRSIHDPLDLDAWYPGDNYVDIVGVSWFENPAFLGDIAQETFGQGLLMSQMDLVKRIMAIARLHEKPLMLAEVTPRGYDLSNLTKKSVHALWDGAAGTVEKSVTSQEIWDDFYQPLFDFINYNSDIVKYVHYIDANWLDQAAWNDQYQYWGDARVQANELVKSNWISEINRPTWIQGNSSVYFQGPENLTYSIDDELVTLNWGAVDEPLVKNFKVTFYKDDTEEHSSEYLATSMTDGTMEKSYSGLVEGTHTVIVSSIDYSGNTIGKEQATFTIGDAGARLGDSDEMENTDFVLYPNTTPGELIIDFELEEASRVDIELYNLNGQVLFNESDYLVKGKHKFRFDDLHRYVNANGVVMVKIVTGKSTVIKRIILE